MTPFQIHVAIHYTTSCVDWTEEHGKSKVWADTLDSFLKLKLLVHEPDVNRLYQPTERLRAYVKFLTEMPLPVAHWELPK